MKKTIIYCFVLLACCAAACKKEYSIEGNGNLNANFTAVIDGNQWAALETKESATIIQGVITLTGISNDDQQISITISDTLPGTYLLNQQSLSVGAYADIDSSDLYAYATNQGTDSAQAGGEVTITAIDPIHKTLTGTFTFKVYRELDGSQKSITMGVFTSIPYTNTPPPAAKTDTIVADIGSAGFTGQNNQASINAGQLSIVGLSQNASQTIGLMMPANVTPGSYPLDGSNVSFGGLYGAIANSTTESFISTQGTLVVQANDPTAMRVKGTFQFTGTDATNTALSIAITNGFFSVYYGP
jgi:hypothetical protein